MEPRPRRVPRGEAGGQVTATVSRNGGGRTATARTARARTVPPNGREGPRKKKVDQSAFGDDVTSPFVPIGVTPHYPPPRRNIDPDRSKSWLKRALPIVLAHKRIFIASLIISFIGLFFQVEIPTVVGEAIDKGLKPNGTPLSPLRRDPRRSRPVPRCDDLLLAPVPPQHRLRASSTTSGTSSTST